MLSIRDVHATYGPVVALRGVSVEAREGTIVALLGPNGAGKTSLLRAVSGLLPLSAGAIEFAGKRLDRLPSERIVQLGVSHVPEGRQTFSALSVLDNLRLGAFTRHDRAAIAGDIDRVFTYFPALRQRRDLHAGLLSGGEQQMLAIARALMARPRLLLLDEPSLGLAPLVVAEIFGTINRISGEEGLTVLVVEQNAEVALAVAQRGYVLDSGVVVLEGTAEELRNNAAVRQSYLGVRLKL